MTKKFEMAVWKSQVRFPNQAKNGGETLNRYRDRRYRAGGGGNWEPTGGEILPV